MSDHLTFRCRFCRGRGRVWFHPCNECDGTGTHRVFVSPAAHERDSILEAVDRLLEPR